MGDNLASIEKMLEEIDISFVSVLEAVRSARSDAWRARRASQANVLLRLGDAECTVHEAAAALEQLVVQLRAAAAAA